VSAPGTTGAAPASNWPGILTMIAGVFGLASMDALGKYLGETYPIAQIVFVRALLGLPFLVLLARLSHAGIGQLRTARPYLHAVRALLAAAGVFSFYTALRFMPLAEVTAIAFAAPLIVTALSAPLLGEPVGWRRWAGVLAGFAGVLIVVQPGTAAFQWAGLVALLAAACYALMLMTARKYAASESALSLVVWSTLGTALLTGVVTPFQWVPPATADLPWFLAIGVLGGLTMLLLTRAFQLAPAAVVAPFDYTAMLWAVGYGWLVWRDVPAPTTWLGSAVIVAAGLYVMHREGRRRS
jgi:drug/metabolite transporter (DMT)-like permease